MKVGQTERSSSGRNMTSRRARTAKSGFICGRTISGEDFVSLARNSEAVLIVLLVLADRVVPEDGKD